MATSAQRHTISTASPSGAGASPQSESPRSPASTKGRKKTDFSGASPQSESPRSPAPTQGRRKTDVTSTSEAASPSTEKSKSKAGSEEKTTEKTTEKKKSKAERRGDKSDKRKAKSNEPIKAPRSWDFKKYDVRCLGQSLRQAGGSDDKITKKIFDTLADGRSFSEATLRRTAIEALMPNARIGHRQTLSAVATLSVDRASSVRRTAIEMLEVAAGGKRPDAGTVVAQVLGESFPPQEAVYDMDARRFTLQTMARLAPKNDPHMMSLATRWINDKDIPTRQYALRTIGEIGSTVEDVDVAAKYLKDPSWMIKNEAIRALEVLAATDRENERLSIGIHEPRRLQSPAGSSLIGDDEMDMSPGGSETSRRSRRSAASGFGTSSSAGKGERRSAASLSSLAGANVPIQIGAADSPDAAPRKTLPASLDSLRDADEKGSSRRRSRDDTQTSQVGLGDSQASKDSTAGRRVSRSESSSRQQSKNTVMSGTEMSVTDTFFSEEESVMSDRDPFPSEIACKILAQMCTGENSEAMGLPRLRSLEALQNICLIGDRDGIKAAADRIGDCDEVVRAQAIKTFVSLSAGDRSEAVDTCVDMLAAWDYRVRGAASKALVLSLTADEEFDCLARVADMLERDDWRDRHVVGVTMAKLATEHFGHEAALAKLAPKLTHPDWSIRRKSVEAYGIVAESAGGMKNAVRTLGCLAHDPDEEIRLVVAKWIPRAAPPKSKEAIAILIPLSSGDDSIEVRRMAINGIADLADEGRSRSRTAIVSIAVGLDDFDAEVREVAVNALKRIGFGRRCAIDSIANRLQAADPNARQAAAEALSGVLGNNTQRITRIFARLIPLYQHENLEVRETVTVAMAGFAKAQREQNRQRDLETIQECETEEPDPDAPVGPDPDAVVKAATQAMNRYAPKLIGERGSALTPPPSPRGWERLRKMSKRGSQVSKSSSQGAAKLPASQDEPASPESPAASASPNRQLSKESAAGTARESSKESTKKDSRKRQSSKESEAGSKTGSQDASPSKKGSKRSPSKVQKALQKTGLLSSAASAFSREASKEPLEFAEVEVNEREHDLLSDSATDEDEDLNFDAQTLSSASRKTSKFSRISSERPGSSKKSSKQESLV